MLPCCQEIRKYLADLWVGFFGKTPHTLMIPIYVIESTKTGLIAYRKILRKAGLIIQSVVARQWLKLRACVEFSHIIQQFLTFKTIL